MIEVDNLSKSETPNLATLPSLPCTGSLNNKLRRSATFLATIRYLLNYKMLYRPNGQEQLNSVFHFYLDCPALSFEITPTSVLTTLSRFQLQWRCVKWPLFQAQQESGMPLYPKFSIRVCPNCVPNFMPLSSKGTILPISVVLYL